MYLQELCQDVYLSAPTLCCLLARHGKHVQVAKQGSILMRAAYMATMCFYSRDLPVWVDETGSDSRDCARIYYGYAIRGQYPVYRHWFGRGQRISVVAAVSTDGVIALETHRGSVTGDVFVDFIRRCLIPNMQEYDGVANRSVVVMDNCSIHHVPKVIKHFRKAGIVVVFLPP